MISDTLPPFLDFVDSWAEYARLKSLGWRQQRIANVKDVSQATVSQRLKFSQVSDKVKGFISKGLLDEFHLMEMCQLLAANTFSPWLTTGLAWEELAQKAVVKQGAMNLGTGSQV